MVDGGCWMLDAGSDADLDLDLDIRSSSRVYFK